MNKIFCLQKALNKCPEGNKCLFPSIQMELIHLFLWFFELIVAFLENLSSVIFFFHLESFVNKLKQKYTFKRQTKCMQINFHAETKRIIPFS